MTLYHGTTYNFTTPDLNKARSNTDFGKGFYLTDKEKMAENWTKGKNNSTIMNYDLSLINNPDSYQLSVKRFTTNEEWFKYVYNNRKGKNTSKDYDIVIGPIADNGIKKFFKLVESKKAKISDVVNEMNMKQFGALQYCFKTKEAIKLLRLCHQEN